MTWPGGEGGVRGPIAPPCPRAARYPEKVMKEEEGGGPGAAPYSSRPQVPSGGDRELGPSPAPSWQGAWGPVWELSGDRIEGLGAPRGGKAVSRPNRRPRTLSSPVPQGRGQELKGKPEGGRQEGEGKPGASPDSLPAPQRFTFP